MATTYELIASNTLSSSAASVTFSAIPNTYTDLVLRTSVRNATNGGASSGSDIRLNGDSSALYSRTRLNKDNSNGVVSTRTNDATFGNVGWESGSTSTSSTFGSCEIYIPNYTSTVNKPFSVFSVSENNDTAQTFIAIVANLYRNTSGITTLFLEPQAGTYAIGSSFFLYGIKNS